MTKSDLADAITERIGYPQKESGEILEHIFETMKSALETGEPVKISGFGTFNVKTKKSRRGRNPQTGEAIELSARKVLIFKASALLKKMLIS